MVDQNHEKKPSQQLEIARDTIPDPINAVRAIVVGQERERIDFLEAEIKRLEIKTEPEGLMQKLNPVMTSLVRQTIQNSPEEMAEAIGPVMGEAIRVQIRDSRQSMIDAIAPIIGSTVQKAIGDFARELQRNIDARLRTSLNVSSLFRNLQARLHGISPAELAIRDALPFSIQEIFLIQSDSGLLVAHYHTGSDQTPDTDLISGMLTAIRDFVKDSFSQEPDYKELEEIQYGEQRIIIQNGRYAYLAVVINGVEPPGFRAKLRDWTSNLFVSVGGILRDYNGDPATLPDLESRLAELDQLDEIQPEAMLPQALTKNQRLAVIITLVGGILVSAICCFYAWFTYALLPIAIIQPSYTATQTATVQPSPTPTVTPTITPSSTPSLTPSLTITPSQTPSFTPSLTATPMNMVIVAVALGDVWLRTDHDQNAPTLGVIRQGTPVYVLSAQGNWLEVDWNNGVTHQRGWAASEWFFLFSPLPPLYTTPQTTP